LIGKKTFKLLNEMGDDLAGMGAGAINFDENDMVMRQPSAMHRDPAMMTGPALIPVI